MPRFVFPLVALLAVAHGQATLLHARREIQDTDYSGFVEVRVLADGAVHFHEEMAYRKHDLVPSEKEGRLAAADLEFVRRLIAEDRIGKLAAAYPCEALDHSELKDVCTKDAYERLRLEIGDADRSRSISSPPRPGPGITTLGAPKEALQAAASWMNRGHRCREPTFRQSDFRSGRASFAPRKL